MSLQANSTDRFWHAATYVDKIFKGAKPADLPVEQPTRLVTSASFRTGRSPSRACNSALMKYAPSDLARSATSAAAKAQKSTLSWASFTLLFVGWEASVE